MKKSLVVLCILLASTLTIFSQNQSDTKNLIDRVSRKLQSYKALKADFSFTLSNSDEQINDTHDGSLILSGDKYRLNIMGILAICNGETLWTINEELKEANIIDPDENDLFNPKSIFTIYEKSFRYEPVSTTGDKVTVDLIPTGIDESYSKIRMDILKSKESIDQVKYFSKDGNQYIVKIKAFQPDIQTNERMFSFDSKQFPGVKVYDMR